MKSLNGCENYRKGNIHSILLISVVFLLDQITKNCLKRHTKGWGLQKRGQYKEA